MLCTYSTPSIRRRALCWRILDSCPFLRLSFEIEGWSIPILLWRNFHFDWAALTIYGSLHLFSWEGTSHHLHPVWHFPSAPDNFSNSQFLITKSHSFHSTAKLISQIELSFRQTFLEIALILCWVVWSVLPGLPSRSSSFQNLDWLGPPDAII